MRSRLPSSTKSKPNVRVGRGEVQERLPVEAGLFVEARNDQDEAGRRHDFAIESTPARPAGQLPRGDRAATLQPQEDCFDDATATECPDSSSLSAALALAAVSALAPAAGAQQPAAKKKVLIVWGGWPGHQPKETVDVFAPWLAEQGFDVEISNSLDSYLDAEKMKGLSLIVQA